MTSQLIDQVLDKLIQARLVHLSPGDTPENEQIELTHESLIHNWNHYQGWLEEEELKRYRRWRLAKDAQDWAMQGRPVDLLLQRRRLTEIQAHESLSQLEKEYIQVSESRLRMLHEQKRTQTNQLKLLKHQFAATRQQEETQRLRLKALEAELQALRLQNASKTGRLQQLENTAAKFSTQKRQIQRHRLLAMTCLMLAITATSIAILASQRVAQIETQQVR
ncbi:hypothetical protein ACQ4M3_40585 [Leptolyngbya sp. AN03gr2]|uniref:nSTAND1 domain-containing NTPase n=1 Tax=unclassified Leptolyngbya TaxID=2650499 RepID=UPI003D321C8C